MISSMRLRNFRGFEDIELSDMCPITLISGRNNVGKSAILEAVFLFFDHQYQDSFIKIDMFRGNYMPNRGTNLWESLFYQMDMSRTMQVEMGLDGTLATLKYVKDSSFVPIYNAALPKEAMNDIIASAKLTYTLKFQYEKGNYAEEGHFIAGQAGILQDMTTNQENRVELMPYIQFINNRRMFDVAIIDDFGAIEMQQKKQDIIDIMQMIDKNIQDIVTISTNGQASLYVKTNDHLLPLNLMGDGTSKLLCLVVSIISHPNSIFLVDEIEGGFHYSMYPKLWEIIATIARKYACQIIATTHSYECIIGAINGIESADRKHEFCYFRINKNNGENRVYRYSHDILCTAIDGEMEVR